ncbi:MAG: hypothetical protein WCY74_06570 [Sphaerochaetaceae bacterium]|nr:hypothetical protein [Sphaerochaetaceae bacterium]MDX9940522.1 hypothetical protein [Sphaerochaetaceae bacterium]
MRRGKRFGMVIMALALAFGVATASASEMSGNLKLIGSTAPEAKVEAGYTVKMPLLQGEGPLFSGNNLKLKGLLGVSPIAATLSVDAVLTPVAVMELSLGGAVGTGWDFSPMNLEGLRLGDGTSVTVTDSLGGVFYKGRAGAALQFDTGAIWSGEWKSVVMRTYHEVNYQGYSNAGTEEGWEYETAGLHMNGLNYKGEYLIGYQMPLIVNTVAVMLETFVDNIGTSLATPMTMDLGLVVNFGFTEKLSLMVIPQLTTRHLAGDDDGNTRVISRQDLGFKRVAAMLNYAL